MRLSSSIKMAAFTLLVIGMAGCQSGGQGGGWRGLSWNPAQWGRPGAGALANSEAPKKPSDESLPTLAVSQGTEVPTDSSTAPPSQYANTTAGYDAAPGYPAPSGYPTASMATTSSPNNAYMAPQKGSYGAYGAGDAAGAAPANVATSYPANGYPSTQSPPAGVANPYRTPVETAAVPATPYPPYGSAPAGAPATSSTSADAQYAASLQSAANPSLATQYANDPNSRFYSGAPTSAISAAPNAPYAGNYSSTASPRDSGANPYPQGGSAYAPPAPQYTASTQSLPTAGAATGAYGVSTPYGATPVAGAASSSFRPGSCTSYPSTNGSSLSAPAATTSPAPSGSYPSPSSPTTTTSVPAASNYSPSGYQAPAYQPNSYY